MLIRRSVCWAAAVVAGMAVLAQAAPDRVQIGGHEAHASRVLARLVETQPPSRDLQADLRSVGLAVQRQFSLVPGGVVLELTPAVALKSDQEPDPETLRARLLSRIELLKASGRFRYVEPDWVVYATLTEPTDRAYEEGLLWGLRNIGQNGGVLGADVLTDPDNTENNAWDIVTGSSNVVVAVIDSGIRYTHQDLRRRMWVNPGEIPFNNLDDDLNGYVDDVNGVNVVTGSGDPWDDVGHGTHVAGIIGASANDDYDHVGVAWDVRLMAVKALSLESGFTSDAVEGIEYAVKHGAKIINASWGNYEFSDLLRDAIIGASTNDVLFVAGAGNDYANDNDLIPFFPASYDVENVISVTALDRKDQLADFANIGAMSVDLGAPGVEILSTFNGSDVDYQYSDGTSMATPFVSGVAALIWSAFPDAPMAEVRARIIQTAVPVADLRGKTVTGGRVNAWRALNASADGEMEVYIDPPDQSVVLVSTNLPVFVKVYDLFPITNAVVQATLPGVSSNIVVDFLNDGVPPDVQTNDHIYTGVFDLTPYTQLPFTNVLTFSLTVTASNMTDFTGEYTYYIVGPPENDHFANAEKVPAEGVWGEDLLVATNTYATLELFEPLPNGDTNYVRSVWWNWSAPANGPVIVDTAGSSFDTVIGIYTGNSLETLKPVAWADNPEGKKQAYVIFNAVKGATYRIQVLGASAEEFGTIRLRVQMGGQPDLIPPIVRIAAPAQGTLFTTREITVMGDAFDPEPHASGVEEVLLRVNGGLPQPVNGTTDWSATVQLRQGANTITVFGADRARNVSKSVTVSVFYTPNEPANDVFSAVLSPSSPFYLTDPSGTNTVDTTPATKEGGEPLHGGNEGGRSVWWTYKADRDGILELTTEGSDFDTLLGLYLGDRVDKLTTVASNDDVDRTNRWSRIVQAIQGGLEYRIAIDGYAGASGNAVLNWNFTPTNTVLITVTAGEGGTTDPAPGTYQVPAGSTFTVTAVPDDFHAFSGWAGSKVWPADNPLEITAGEDVAIEARFWPRAFSDGFESGGFATLPWQMAGDLPWVITEETAAAGVRSARSGVIGDNQTSVLRLTMDFRDGRGAFDFKVSTEEGWDYFEFLIDGRVMEKRSGESDWSRYEFTLTAGRHTLEWRYRKDSRDAAGLDAVFIDNVDLPAVLPPDPAQPALLSIRQLFDGRMQIELKGQTNQVYIIQQADKVTGPYRSVATNIATQGVIRFTELEPPMARERYYRAKVGR
ncbi:MAG: hypothetical protein D6766_06435 [Verrucomicrobia bacterium]|nr:MAG: hypothetical protein D6766_06435 [Verrucomicrobiota bacterium]